MFTNYKITKFLKLDTGKIFTINKNIIYDIDELTEEPTYSQSEDGVKVTLDSMLNNRPCVQSGHFKIVEVEYNNQILQIGTQFKTTFGGSHIYKIIDFIYENKIIRIQANRKHTPKSTWEEKIDSEDITYLTEEKQPELPTIQQTYTLHDINKVLSNVLDKVELDMILDEFKRILPSNDIDIPQEASKAVKSNDFPLKWALKINSLEEGQYLKKINNNRNDYNYNAIDDTYYYHFDMSLNKLLWCESYIKDEYTKVSFNELKKYYDNILLKDLLPF